MSKAREFAELAGTEVQPWMEWEGWTVWVGCDTCAGDGPEAPCWGYTGCHGYLQGCGCRECTDQEAKEAKEAG
ncbi:MAG: hypothetical protein D9V47_09270 [Clostridia bacterium]|nr:MAG: hypothetical protein D9V47_09270 [Clostridia bacterium]